MNNETFKPGDQVFNLEENIKGTVRVAYSTYWGPVIDVMSSERKVIYASPVKKWRRRHV